MKKLSVLISGAGIAGPAAAFWLQRAGFDTTVVECWPALRQGGQAVDFRGPVHREILQRMGLWEAIHERQTHLGGHVMLDAQGRPCATMPSLMFSGEVEILRGDLSQLLYDRTRQRTEYLFADTLVGLEELESGVRAHFERARPRTFDLVIGADGLHSRVRALAFGDEQQFLRHHGYCVAGFTLPNILGLKRTAQTYSVVGKSVSISSARNENEARALFCFQGGPLGPGQLQLAEKHRMIEEAFKGVGWEVPRLLAAMREASDLFFDTISTVHMGCSSKGRIVLVGDAAFGGTLGGQGTPLAIIGAYVLAGELGAANGEHRRAFERYEALMRPYAMRGQNGSHHVGAFHAPPSHFSLKFRNFYLRVFATRLFSGLFERIVTSAAKDFTLPDYTWARTSGPSSVRALPD